MSTDTALLPQTRLLSPICLEAHNQQENRLVKLSVIGMGLTDISVSTGFVNKGHYTNRHRRLPTSEGAGEFQSKA